MLARLQVPVDVVDLRPCGDADNTRIKVISDTIGTLLVYVDDEDVWCGGTEACLAHLRSGVNAHGQVRFVLRSLVDLLLDPRLDLVELCFRWFLYPLCLR